MEKNKKLEKFFEGKGFYIVLALCIAVIAISAFSIARDSKVPEIGTDISLDNNHPIVTPDIDGGTAPVVSTEPPEELPETEETVTVWTPEDVWTAPATWVWPVSGGIERGYAMEALSYDVTMADWRTHDGVDIMAENGANVLAAADGTVEKVYNDALYGTTVVIDHGGDLKTTYSNLAETPAVAVGDKVKAGDVLGSVGTTALCEIGEGNHVHFAMSQSGESTDPMEYLPKR